MWTLVTALLLSSLCCGSAQILFKKIESVTVTGCEKDVVIPCHATNMNSGALNDMHLLWFFRETRILFFNGLKNTTTRNSAFQSGRISPSAFLKGDASLILDKNEAKAGNYTCEVTELRRVGKQTVKLKYRASWFPFRENILIIVFPFVTILLFWAQYAILMNRYRSSFIHKKMIVLSNSGLLFTMVAIAGAFLFIPGEFSEMKSIGLILLVSSSVIPIFLQYFKFMPAIGRTLGVMIILTVIQALCLPLIIVGLYLTANGIILSMPVEEYCLHELHGSFPECEPKYGYLLVSGLIIATPVELLGFIYLLCIEPIKRYY